MSFSRFSGWLMTAFLLGIAAHSTHPYVRISPAWMMIGMGLSLCAWSFTKQELHQKHNPHSRYFPVLLLFFLLGLYRFSLAQPSLPRGLIFANPKGLAFTIGASSRTANQLDPRHWFSRARVELTSRAKTVFPPDQAILLTGMLYGERGFSPATKTAFRHAGLLHMVAVSGSNMTLVTVLVMRLLLLARLRRRTAFFVTIFAVGSYTFFVGLSAAVVRAALMGILIELAPIVGRLVRPTRLLLISAFLFTMWHPWALFFDPSFALSFFAMLGLLTYGRRFHDVKTPFHHSMMRETVASTLAATLFTTPYAAWAFGNVTLWGLLTNLLVAPLIPWTMFLGIPGLLINHSLARTPVQGCLQAILWIAHLPDRFSAGYFDHAFLSWPWFVASYVLLFFAYRTQNLSTQAQINGSVLARSITKK